ncbi:ribosome maturation protein RimP [Rhizobium sp. Pop5]|nr:ribosome maturation protein RimP [Rhizobium sp. Pop5]
MKLRGANRLSDLTNADNELEPRLITETGLDQRLADIIEPVLIGMGFRLIRVRMLNQNGATMQVMAERNDGTMTVQDCEEVSMAISPVLDVEDPIDKEYHLEVSSPGIDRPMVRKSDFVRWQGHLVKCETSIMVGNRKRFRGKILEADADGFTLERDQVAYGEELKVIIPFTALSEAKLILTDDLIRDALRADKLAKAQAANQNEADDQE